MASVRGATLLGPDKLELREYPMPDIPADGGLLKIEMGGVCGTDVKYLHGKLKVDYPIILGHEILGRVEKLGKNAAAIHHVKEGDRVILKGALGCAAAPTAGATTNASAASAPTTAAGPNAISRPICSVVLPITSTWRPTFWRQKSATPFPPKPRPSSARSWPTAFNGRFAAAA